MDFLRFFFTETPVTQYMKVEEQVWDSNLEEFPDPDFTFSASYDRLKWALPNRRL